MKTQKSFFEQNGGTYMQVGDVLLPNLTYNSQGGAEETVSYTDGKGRAVFHPEYNTLTITASKGLEEEDKDKMGKIVHQERYEGSMTRSFYIGENVKEEDVQAKYETP